MVTFTKTVTEARSKVSETDGGSRHQANRYSVAEGDAQDDAEEGFSSHRKKYEGGQQFTSDGLRKKSESSKSTHQPFKLQQSQSEIKISTTEAYSIKGDLNYIPALPSTSLISTLTSIPDNLDIKH